MTAPLHPKYAQQAAEKARKVVEGIIKRDKNKKYEKVND